MKVAFVKIRDPILFNVPDRNVYEEELELIHPPIICDAGIIIFEDAERLILGEANYAEDNQKLVEWSVTYPYYRNVRVIHKSQIVERTDHEWNRREDDAGATG
jgi:hypothetical protein